MLWGGDGEGGLYSEVQCIMDNGYMGTPPPANRQTDTHK